MSYELSQLVRLRDCLSEADEILLVWIGSTKNDYATFKLSPIRGEVVAALQTAIDLHLTPKEPSA